MMLRRQQSHTLVQESCVCIMLCAVDKRQKTAKARVLGIPDVAGGHLGDAAAPAMTPQNPGPSRPCPLGRIRCRFSSAVSLQPCSVIFRAECLQRTVVAPKILVKTPDIAAVLPWRSRRRATRVLHVAATARSCAMQLPRLETWKQSAIPSRLVQLGQLAERCSDAADSAGMPRYRRTLD